MFVVMADVAQLLRAIDAGDPRAAADLLPLVYDELRKLAARRLAQEKSGQTLQATALVHEAYIRLVGKKRGGAAAGGDWNSRGHFFAAAAQAMRRILVENARRKRRRKRGGGLVRQDLAELDVETPHGADDVLALDEALTKLSAADKPAADLVQLRFFAGLPLAEAARILDISPRTADRLWAYARAWLHEEIRGDIQAE